MRTQPHGITAERPQREGSWALAACCWVTRWLLMVVGVWGCTGEILVAPAVAPTCGEAPRLKRLGAAEYQTKVAPLFPDGGPRGLVVPFSQRRRTDLFSTWAGQASLSEYDVDDVWSAADAIATAWTDARPQLCIGSARTPSCLRAVFGPLLSALWSRTATDADLSALATSLDDAERELPPKQAVVATLRELLMSPDFLFRAELGVEGRLSAVEVAGALAFTLSEAPPDARLLQLADTGALETAEAVGEEARRLLARPAEVPALRRFLRELLQYENATLTQKDAKAFPFHRPSELIDDTEQVVERLVTEHARAGLHRALLTSDLVYVRPSTAQSWGLTLSTDAGVFLHDRTRAGVLTHPSWLVAMSEPDHNHLVRRGRFVRERLLCGEVPMLPGGVVPEVEKKPGLTFRQRLERHSSDPACAGCHQLMDPLGMGFEAWDHLGRAQREDNGGVVVTRGELGGAGEVDGPYDDARQLMERLAESPEVRACWVKQVFRFVRGRDVGSADRCELERLTRAYEASGEDTVALLEVMFASDAFLNRTPVTP